MPQNLNATPEYAAKSNYKKLHSKHHYKIQKPSMSYLMHGLAAKMTTPCGAIYVQHVVLHMVHT
jgi:hypothetical protein